MQRQKTAPFWSRCLDGPSSARELAGRIAQQRREDELHGRGCLQRWRQSARRVRHRRGCSALADCGKCWTDRGCSCLAGKGARRLAFPRRTRVGVSGLQAALRPGSLAEKPLGELLGGVPAAEQGAEAILSYFGAHRLAWDSIQHFL